MKTLGIDYGSKRVGLAISDDSQTIAFPLKIIENKNLEYLIQSVLDILITLNIKKIVIGLSLDKNNNPNPIYFETQKFEKTLKQRIENTNQITDDIQIFWQKEWYSSVEARNTPARLTRSGNTKKINKQDSYIDDKAACIILQQFLDKR